MSLGSLEFLWHSFDLLSSLELQRRRRKVRKRTINVSLISCNTVGFNESGGAGMIPGTKKAVDPRVRSALEPQLGANTKTVSFSVKCALTFDKHVCVHTVILISRYMQMIALRTARFDHTAPPRPTTTHPRHCRRQSITQPNSERKRTRYDPSFAQVSVSSVD